MGYDDCCRVSNNCCNQASDAFANMDAYRESVCSNNLLVAHPSLIVIVMYCVVSFSTVRCVSPE